MVKTSTTHLHPVNQPALGFDCVQAKEMLTLLAAQ